MALTSLAASRDSLHRLLIDDSYLATTQSDPALHFPILKVLVDDLSGKSQEARHFLLRNNQLNTAVTWVLRPYSVSSSCMACIFALRGARPCRTGGCSGLDEARGPSRRFCAPSHYWDAAAMAAGGQGGSKGRYATELG
jgi:hypothetical protein